MVIKEFMKFDEFNDFYDRRDIIKKSFQALSNDEKDIYKLYLYAKREMKTFKIDMIWEYLHEPSDSKYLPSDEALRRYYKNNVKNKGKGDV